MLKIKPEWIFFVSRCKLKLPCVIVQPDGVGLGRVGEGEQHVVRVFGDVIEAVAFKFIRDPVDELPVAATVGQVRLGRQSSQIVRQVLRINIFGDNVGNILAGSKFK